MSTLDERIKLCRARLEGAASRRGRKASDVTLIAVSKGVPAAMVTHARELGLTDFGENRVQEARLKVPESPADAVWHLIGHLQTNKVKHAVTMFSLVHSLDREELAVEIQRQCDRFDVTCNALIQVNVAMEDTKSGVEPARVMALIESLRPLDRIRVMGLMTIAPYVDDSETVRPWFRMLAGIREEIEKRDYPRVNMRHLSMGMSGDFEVAVEEGATMVRIGTAIFGPRPQKMLV